MPVNTTTFYKQFLPISLFLSISLNAFAQQEINSSNYYELGNYRIYPQEKIITQGGMFGECTKNGVCRDGYGYFPLEHLDFDNTALVFINRQMHFKEDLPSVDLNTLETLYPDTPVLHRGTIYSFPVFADKKNLYISINSSNALTDEKSPGRISLPQMPRINPYLLKSEQGEYFVILRNIHQPEDAIQKLEELDLDPATLKYVAGNFYTDKNGLYWLGSFYNSKTGKHERNKKLEDRHGKSIVPQIMSDSICYDEAIYVKNASSPTKYPYQASDVAKRVKHYDILKNGKVTAGYYNNPAPVELAFHPYVVMAQDAYVYAQNDELFFKGVQSVGESNSYGMILKTDNNYLLVNNGNNPNEVKPFRQLNIYNVTKNAYEPFETQHYRQIDEEFYIYKGALYGYGAPTFSNDTRFDYTKLQRISYSYYYTDGKYMFYNDQQDKYRYTLNYNRTFQPINPRMIIENVDFTTLEIVNENLLIDKDRIYTLTNNPEPGIQVIPRNKLGIKTIAIGATKFQIQENAE